MWMENQGYVVLYEKLFENLFYLIFFFVILKTFLFKFLLFGIILELVLDKHYRNEKNYFFRKKKYNIKTNIVKILEWINEKNLALTYLTNFPVPPLFYQSPYFVPYIITIFLFSLPPPICLYFFFLKER